MGHEIYDLGERTVDHGLDRVDDVRAAADATQDWVQDRAADMTEGLSGAADEVGDSVREVQDDMEDTVTDLGRGLLNLADHPPWWR